MQAVVKQVGMKGWARPLWLLLIQRLREGNNVGHHSVVTSKVGCLVYRRHGVKTGLPGDGVEAVMHGMSVVQGLKAIIFMLMGHKCACMRGDLTDHVSGKAWVFGFFDWALRLFIFFGNWAFKTREIGPKMDYVA